MMIAGRTSNQTAANMAGIARSPADSEITLSEKILRVNVNKEEEMPVKLHRCRSMWLKIGGHPCWRVQKALDRAGVEYEVVTGPLSRSKRAEIARLSGQNLYPVIEFEDGRVYREQSKEMAARIGAGELFEAPATTPSASE
jgi:hypothetical protein